MKTLSKVIAVIMAAVMAFGFSSFAFAEGESEPELKNLDTSAINGRLYAYKGVETYFVVYPEPEDAEYLFDIRDAEITVSKEGIIECHPEKVEEYRYGSVIITGIKLGSTEVTVTDPGSGLSCKVKVTVLPSIIYKIRNFYMFIDYIPYYIFARLYGHIG